MIQLILEPNISVGPFVFGTSQKEIWEIMKNEFNSERELPTDRSLPAFETEYYENPNVHLEYKDNKLISITFIDDIRKRYCEIYLGKEKIWPRTEKKFLSIFNSDSFVDVFGSYRHPDLSLAACWDDNPPSLLIAQAGYCAEAIENFKLFNTVSDLKKGMPREVVRKLIKHTPQISDDGRTDHYSLGSIAPEVTSLTFDSNDNLIKITKKFTSGNKLNISLK